MRYASVMKFVVWLLVCAVCVLAEESPPQEEPDVVATTNGDRGARFVNINPIYDQQIETNEVLPDSKQDPNSALKGVYSDCVMSFSITCLQKKFLVFLDKLGRMDGFSVLGDFLTVKRTTKETVKPISEKVINARMNTEEELDSLVDYSINRFFSTHKLQVKLPFGLSVIDDTNIGRNYRTDSDIVNIAFPDDKNDEFQGRNEGRVKKLIKKKLLMGLLSMAKAKFALLAPLLVILVKIKAIKALFIAKIALALAVFSALGKAGIGGLGGLGALGLGGLGAGLSGGSSGTVSTQTYTQGAPQVYTQTAPHGSSHHGSGQQKIVIIHDPHHVGGGGGGGGHGGYHGGGGGYSGGGHGGSHGSGGHSHGHTASTGFDGYGPSGSSGSYSSGGGSDSYGPGGGGGSWGRSWSPTDPSNPNYRHNTTAKPTT